MSTPDDQVFDHESFATDLLDDDGTPDPGEAIEAEALADAPADPPAVEAVVDDPGPAAEEGTDPAEGKTVPLAALHESRNEVKGLKDENVQLRTRLDQFFDELRTMRSERAAPPAGEVPVEETSEYIEDPEAYVKDAEGRVTREFEKRDAEQAVRDEQAQTQRLVAHLGTLEAAHIAENPDYTEARTFIREQNAQDLLVLYPDLEPAQIQAAIYKGEQQIARQMMSTGKNPVQELHKMAIRRGFKAGTTPGASEDEVPGETPPAIDPADVARVDKTAKGQKAMPGAGGAAGTVTDLLETSDEDFEVFAAAHKESAWGRKH